LKSSTPNLKNLKLLH